jgi:hypothetical protein
MSTPVVKMYTTQAANHFAPDLEEHFDTSPPKRYLHLTRTILCHNTHRQDTYGYRTITPIHTPATRHPQPIPVQSTTAGPRATPATCQTLHAHPKENVLNFSNQHHQIQFTLMHIVIVLSVLHIAFSGNVYTTGQLTPLESASPHILGTCWSHNTVRVTT